MSDDIEKIDEKIEELQKKKREKLQAKKAEKIDALGKGIMAAVKAGHLSWSDIKPALSKVVKSKKSRQLLELGELPPPLPNPNHHGQHAKYGS